MKLNLKYLPIYLLGLTILGISVAFIQQTNLGMSAWDALNRNFYEGFHLPYSIINPVVAVVLISVAFLLNRRKASLWMLFPLVISFYVGLVIDLVLLFLPSVAGMSLAWNLGYLFFAIVICSIGLNLVLYCEYPLPALDELCKAIAMKLHVSFGKGKLIGEGIAIVLSIIVGFLFHFEDQLFFIGITTIIFGLFIGFVVDFFKKPVTKVLGGIYENRDLR